MLTTHALANRAQFQPDPIDDICAQIPLINEARLAMGLPAIIDLTAGVPHIPINPEVMNNFIHTLTQSSSDHHSHLKLGYSPLPGTLRTREAISALYKHYYPKLDYTCQEVMICNGATQGCWNALSILIDVGDEVLLFEPYYSNYATQINMLGGKIIKISTQENAFKPSAMLLEAALSKHPKAKALILNYPNNPTGIDLTIEVVTEIVNVLQKHPHLAIIIDDVYRELCYSEHYTVLDIDPSLKDRCIVINSASKGLIGAPGIRAGMIGANQEWIKRMATIQAISVCSISTLTEKMLIAGIDQQVSSSSHYLNWIEDAKTEYSLNKAFLGTELATLGFNITSGDHGFFVLAKSHVMQQPIPNAITVYDKNGKQHTIDDLQQKIGATQLDNDLQLTAYLLHAVGVAVVRGSAFGIDEKLGYLRFSCTRSIEDLKLSIVCINQALNGLTERNIEYAQC